MVTDIIRSLPFRNKYNLISRYLRLWRRAISIIYHTEVMHPFTGSSDGWHENKKVSYCYSCGVHVRDQKHCHNCGRYLLWPKQ